MCWRGCLATCVRKMIEWREELKRRRWNLRSSALSNLKLTTIQPTALKREVLLKGKKKKHKRSKKGFYSSRK